MAEYIERGALIERLKFKRDTDISKKKYSGLECAISQVKKARAADVVQVVRCRDCKHMERIIVACHCKVWGHFNGAGLDGFCNYGERRDEE